MIIEFFFYRPKEKQKVALIKTSKSKINSNQIIRFKDILFSYSKKKKERKKTNTYVQIKSHITSIAHWFIDERYIYIYQNGHQPM